MAKKGRKKKTPNNWQNISLLVGLVVAVLLGIKGFTNEVMLIALVLGVIVGVLSLGINPKEYLIVITLLVLTLSLGGQIVGALRTTESLSVLGAVASTITLLMAAGLITGLNAAWQFYKPNNKS